MFNSLRKEKRAMKQALSQNYATPTQLQSASGRVVVNLFGESPLELLVTQYGTGPEYVLSVGGTLLVGLTPESAARWVEVLSVIAAESETEETIEILPGVEAIADELESALDSTPASDEYARGRRSGLTQALRIVRARLSRKKAS